MSVYIRSMLCAFFSTLHAQFSLPPACGPHEMVFSTQLDPPFRDQSRPIRSITPSCERTRVPRRYRLIHAVAGVRRVTGQGGGFDVNSASLGPGRASM